MTEASRHGVTPSRHGVEIMNKPVCLRWLIENVVFSICFIMVFPCWQQNFDFHVGRAVKQIRNHSETCSIGNMARDNSGHAEENTLPDDDLPRRTLATTDRIEG